MSGFLTTDFTDFTDFISSYPRPFMSSGVLFCLSPHDSFPLQLRFLEVQEQRDFESGDVQVTEHLCEMGLVECGNDLWIHDHQAFYNQVGNELADQLASIVDPIPAVARPYARVSQAR